MTTYDWADSWAAFEMARENKTDYLTELTNPSTKAKIMAVVFRREWQATETKLKAILAKLQIETTE